MHSVMNEKTSKDTSSSLKEFQVATFGTIQISKMKTIPIYNVMNKNKFMSLNYNTKRKETKRKTFLKRFIFLQKNDNGVQV